MRFTATPQQEKRNEIPRGAPYPARMRAMFQRYASRPGASFCAVRNGRGQAHSHAREVLGSGGATPSGCIGEPDVPCHLVLKEDVVGADYPTQVP